MKEKRNTIAETIIIVLLVVLGLVAVWLTHSQDLYRTTSESVPTEATVEQTVVTTDTAPKETIEETQPVVDNPVEDVDNSVESTAPWYTEEELEILAIIIYQEAGSNACSDDTRRKVGSVFLNRVAHPKFPDTFKAVATAKKQYGKLYKTGIKWPARASKKSEAKAVQRAYRIAEELLVGGSILPENVVFQAPFKQGSGVYCYQDGTYFCYTGGKK